MGAGRKWRLHSRVGRGGSWHALGTRGESLESVGVRTLDQVETFFSQRATYFNRHVGQEPESPNLPK